MLRVNCVLITKGESSYRDCLRINSIRKSWRVCNKTIHVHFFLLVSEGFLCTKIKVEAF